jgi:hypothetical protein
MILSLWWWYFFNHNTRHGIPASSTISETTTLALANPEPHTYVTFRNLVTVAFNMAVTKGVDLGRFNVNNSFNSRWFCTFCTIKCKIPSIANITAIRTSGSFVEHTEWGVVLFLVENTVLFEQNRQRVFRIRLIKIRIRRFEIGRKHSQVWTKYLNFATKVGRKNIFPNSLIHSGN